MEQRVIGLKTCNIRVGDIPRVGLRSCADTCCDITRGGNSNFGFTLCCLRHAPCRITTKEFVDLSELIATVKIGLHPEQIFGITEVSPQTGRHLIGRSEESRECFRPGHQNGVSRINGIQHHRTVIGIDDCLHTVADVIEVVL